MKRLCAIVILLAVAMPGVALATLPLSGVGGGTSGGGGIPAFQAAISTLSNMAAGDAFDSSPKFIPPVAGTYETAVSVMLADELFGGL